MNGIKTKALSIGLGGIAAVSLLMTGGQAHAQAACGTGMSVSVVTAPGFSCLLGDKTFSAFTITGTAPTATVDFGILNSELFAVTLGRDGGFFPTGRVIFDYTIAAAAPQNIVQGTLGVDVSFPTVVTTTSMNALLLGPITNGGTQMVVFGPGVGTVVVDNTVKINGTGELNSISNDFTQTMVGVPEPASLSLFGLGLLGLGFARRRHS